MILAVCNNTKVFKMGIKRQNRNQKYENVKKKENTSQKGWVTVYERKTKEHLKMHFKREVIQLKSLFMAGRKRKGHEHIHLFNPNLGNAMHAGLHTSG